MAYLGKDVRIHRLMPEGDNYYFGIAVDHSIARGIMPGLDHIDDTLVKLVAGGPNALTMHKGIADKCYGPHAGKVPLVLKCTTFSPYHFAADVPVATVEEAVKLGADAVSVGCIVGGDNQPEQLRTLANFAKDAAEWGMPLVSHIYPRGNLIPDEDRNSWKHVAYATRMAAELGVDFIKTHYTGDPDSFAKVVEATPSRVLVAGGEVGETVQDYIKMTRDVIDAGGRGVTYGRFVFTYKNPTALVKTLYSVIHKGMSVTEAMEYLEHLENS